MYRFVSALAELQKVTSIENPPFRMALVTARNFEFMQRPIETLRTWGIRLDKAYLIGNLKKSQVLRDLNAVMFFDDSPKHCADAVDHVPTALVLQPVTTQQIEGRASAPNERIATFQGVCRLVLRKEYSKHEQTLMTLYEARILELNDADFASKIAEFERSAKGTPRGKDVRQRQAAGPENSDFHKLKAFLDDLLEDRRNLG